MKLRPLINNQHILIDAHSSGVPLKWDHEEGEAISDIHLDKSMNQKVHGKKVAIRVSLNNDRGITEPKKCERNDAEWMKAYEKMKKEVVDTLSYNEDLRDQLVNDITKNIIEIGPRKEKRAIRKAIKRIANYFGLEENLFSIQKELKRGIVSLYNSNNQSFYVGFGYDYNFYIGQGDAIDFSRRVKIKVNK